MVPISPPVHGLSVASGLTSTLIHMAYRSTLLRLRDDGQLDAAGLQQLAALAMPQPDSTLVSQAMTGRGVAAMLRLCAMSQVRVFICCLTALLTTIGADLDEDVDSTCVSLCVGVTTNCEGIGAAPVMSRASRIIQVAGDAKKNEDWAGEAVAAFDKAENFLQASAGHAAAHNSRGSQVRDILCHETRAVRTLLPYAMIETV